VAIVLGLLVAITYGSADFFGGVSSKRASVPAVVVLSQVSGLPLLAVLFVVAGGTASARAIGLGGIAGAVGAIGLVCLYRGLSSGRMSVVAPITGVGAAIVPVAWGLVRGERPGAPALVGIVLALAAVTLVSRTDDGPGGGGGMASPMRRSQYVGLGVVAGLAFGTVFVLFAEAGPGAGFWPLAAGRATSIPLLALGTLATGRSFRLAGRSAVLVIAVTGVLDVSANMLFLVASRRGLLALVGVVSSLYPAATVVLARFVLHERLRPVQLVGLGLAATGVVLIAS
jgi:drug/metabolite transporter (DMT)-like permease